MRFWHLLRSISTNWILLFLVSASVMLKMAPLGPLKICGILLLKIFRLERYLRALRMATGNSRLALTELRFWGMISMEISERPLRDLIDLDKEVISSSEKAFELRWKVTLVDDLKFFS